MMEKVWSEGVTLFARILSYTKTVAANSFALTHDCNRLLNSERDKVVSGKYNIPIRSCRSISYNGLLFLISISKN